MVDGGTGRPPRGFAQELSVVYKILITPRGQIPSGITLPLPNTDSMKAV
jgi:hypothetical protein